MLRQPVIIERIPDMDIDRATTHVASPPEGTVDRTSTISQGEGGGDSASISAASLEEESTTVLPSSEIVYVGLLSTRPTLTTQAITSTTPSTTISTTTTPITTTIVSSKNGLSDKGSPKKGKIVICKRNVPHISCTINAILIKKKTLSVGKRLTVSVVDYLFLKLIVGGQKITQ